MESALSRYLRLPVQRPKSSVQDRVSIYVLTCNVYCASFAMPLMKACVVVALGFVAMA